MKKFIIACVAVAAFAAPAFAADGATYQLKDQGTQVDLSTNPVGFYSSQATGNGGVVGGNNLQGVFTDQTTGPGTRAAIVQDALASVGKGSGK
jgi:hypothetical protein